MIARHFRSVSISLAAWFVVTHAHAEPGRDAVAAEMLFQRGVEALKADNWPEACAKFQSSMQLDPAVATALKLARCHRRDLRLADAWYAYQEALKLNRLLPQTEARRTQLEAIALRELRELEPLVPRIRIRVERSVPGMQLRRNGVLLPAGAIGEELFVDPGKHEVVLQAPGYIPEKRSITIAAGDKRELTLSLKADASVQLATPASDPTSDRPKPASDEPKPIAKHSSFWNTQRVAGASLAGAGAASLAVAAFFGVRTLSKVNEANDDHCVNNKCDQEGDGLMDEARTAQTTGLILLGAGVTVLVTGGLLFFTAESKLDKTYAGVSFEPERLRIVW